MHRLEHRRALLVQLLPDLLQFLHMVVAAEVLRADAIPDSSLLDRAALG